MTLECSERLGGRKTGNYALIPGDRSHNISLRSLLLRRDPSVDSLICCSTNIPLLQGASHTQADVQMVLDSRPLTHRYFHPIKAKRV